MTTETIALKRYNSLFDNQQYSAIAERIAADLRVPRDSVRVSDVMNEITNTALSLCNHNHYTQSPAQVLRSDGYAQSGGVLRQWRAWLARTHGV